MNEHYGIGKTDSLSLKNKNIHYDFFWISSTIKNDCDFIFFYSISTLKKKMTKRLLPTAVGLVVGLVYQCIQYIVLHTTATLSDQKAQNRCVLTSSQSIVHSRRQQEATNLVKKFVHLESAYTKLIGRL